MWLSIPIASAASWRARGVIFVGVSSSELPFVSRVMVFMLKFLLSCQSYKNLIAQSLNTAFVHCFEQLHAVAIVDVHPDEYRPWRVESLVERWRYFVRVLNLEAHCTEGFGILHVIHRAKRNARSALVLNLLLRGHHVIAPIDPDHMD